MKFISHAAALLSAAALATAAHAQTSTSRVVNPDRPDQKNSDHFIRGERLASPQKSAPAPNGAVKPFVLRDIAVEKTSLDKGLIDQIVLPFIGTTVDEQALGRIADQVASLYQSTDIALYSVAVPHQDFKDGHLTLVAIEGHISRVTAKGETGKDLSQVQRYASRLTAEDPLRRPSLERYVSLMRDIPGFNPGLSLESGQAPNEVQLAIDAPPQDFRIAASVNNRGTALLGRTQFEVDGYYYGLLRQGDETRLTLALPSEVERFQFYALSHSTILDDEGTTLSGNISHLETRPDFLTLEGEATSLGFQISHPFIRDFNHALYGTLGVDGLNASNALFGQTIGSDRVRSLRGSLSYAWQGQTDFARVSGSVSTGINGLGARTLFPAGTDLDFKKFNGKAIFNTEFIPHWILRFDAAGQYSPDLLPASEQFALGGEEFGRAYEAAFIAGDSAYTGSAELAYRLDTFVPDRLQGTELYGYLDGGRVLFNDRGFGTSNGEVASVGGGSRILLDQRYQLQLELTKGLDNPLPLQNRTGWRGIFAFRTIF